MVWVFVKPPTGPRLKELRTVNISCMDHPVIRPRRHRDCMERVEIGYLEYVVCTCPCHYVAYEEAQPC